MTVRFVQREVAAPPDAPIDLPEQDRKAADAARRALPMQRLVGNGMEYADAVALHGMAERGIAWPIAATCLGEANLQRAGKALADGAQLTAASYFEYAAACFRFGQSQYFYDTEEKIALYRRSLDAFTSAARLRAPGTEKIELPIKGGALSGWLLKPIRATKPPIVIVFGGADGWREEYHKGALYLVERGLGVLLLDGLGQGESRLLRKLYIDGPPDEAYSAVLDMLLERSLTEKVGIWGNSLGGCFAARAASRDARFAACCVNGGASDPTEAIRQFPRMGDRIGAMLGHRDGTHSPEFVEQLKLEGDENRIACPLLVVHGGADPLFSVANAKRIYDDSPSKAKTMVVWDDGDHCIYNHPHEKHSLIADWFAMTLAAQPTNPISNRQEVQP